MWVVGAFKPIVINNGVKSGKATIVYNNLFYFFLKPYATYVKGCFFYCSKHSVPRNILRVGFEHTHVLFRYAGKAYRVSRRKNIMHLNFHYPTYKYLVWRNIIIKHKKKRKKQFKITYNTLLSVSRNLCVNLYKLRPLNTYTKRGVFLSTEPYYQRKPKSTTKR